MWTELNASQNSLFVCFLSEKAVQVPQTSGTGPTDDALPTRCITFAWKKANSLGNTRARVSLLHLFMHTKSKWQCHEPGYENMSSCVVESWPCLCGRLQVWSLLNRRAQTGHHQHLVKSWALSHHGGLGHLLLHQHLQGRELCVCQGSEGTVMGRHRGKYQRSAAEYLPWTHTPASP